MKQVETSAKRLQDAIDEGLRLLNASRDDVDIEVLEQGGFFKKAKVRLTLSGSKADIESSSPAPVEPAERPKPEAEKKTERQTEKPRTEKPAAKSKDRPQDEGRREKKAEHRPKPVRTSTDKAAAEDTDALTAVCAPAIASHKPRHEAEAVRRVPVTEAELTAVKAYLERVIGHMGVTGAVDVRGEEGILYADIVTEDSAVIGHRGEVLDALQTLAKRAAENVGGKHTLVRIDSQGYRVRREESLISLARRQADRCAKTGRKVVLEPMSSAHRKVVHAALGEDARITTRSEGRDPNRRIVIFPKR